MGSPGDVEKNSRIEAGKAKQQKQAQSATQGVEARHDRLSNTSNAQTVSFIRKSDSLNQGPTVSGNTLTKSNPSPNTTANYKRHDGNATTSNTQALPALKASTSQNRGRISGGSNSSPPAPRRDTNKPENRGRGPESHKTGDSTTNGRDQTSSEPSSTRKDSSPGSKSTGKDGPVTHKSGEVKLNDNPTASKATATVQNTKPRISKIITYPHEELIIQTLPKEYLPTHPKDPKRLLVIGDVHGMIDAMNHLLKVINYDPDNDHLVCVGDIITKGTKNKPSRNGMTEREIEIEASVDVLQMAMRSKASVVRGNHEDWVLNIEHLRNGWTEEKVTRSLDAGFEQKRNLRTPKPEDKDPSDYILYDKLNHEEKEWLKKLPHILILGDVGGHKNMVVVHAGLNPKRALEKQHVIETMNIKSINPKNGETSSSHKTDKEISGDKAKREMPEKDKQSFSQMKPWFECLESDQKQLEKLESDLKKLGPGRDKSKAESALKELKSKLGLKTTTTVLYGHESKRGWTEEPESKGFTKRKFSLGLDSGVNRTDDPKKYRALTALLISYKSCEIVQVKNTMQKTGERKWTKVELTAKESKF